MEGAQPDATHPQVVDEEDNFGDFSSEDPGPEDLSVDLQEVPRSGQRTSTLESLEIPAPEVDDSSAKAELNVSLDEEVWHRLLEMAEQRGVPVDALVGRAIQLAHAVEQADGERLLVVGGNDMQVLELGQDADSELRDAPDTNRMLTYLAEPRSESVLEIAAGLGLDSDRTQRILRWLRREGLVTNTDSPVDLYGGIYYLTEAGFHTARQLASSRESRNRR